MPLVRVYGPTDLHKRGGAVTVNFYDENNQPLDHRFIEQKANEANISLRTGCFCNPGAAERAFDFDRHDINGCLDSLGESFSVAHFQERIGPRATVGALRVSVGIPTNTQDIDRAVAALAGFRAC